ncbi:helix-turn-helix domain-containing protein [Amycolatopsis japonica]|uniref:helix-turn-helix domain-containing protein n=1 Tax=Amycolatopsis japonica TaxID=208439 RepID=UPI0036702568
METRLRKWRTDRGWTLDEVAGLTGISESMLSRVENGKKALAPATRVQVARRLGAKVADLFEVDPIRDSVAA